MTQPRVLNGKKSQRLVIIEWHDACSISEWQSLEKIEEWINKDDGFLCQSVGWVISENKDFIVLAARKSEADNQYGLCEKLPKKMIRKITNI